MGRGWGEPSGVSFIEHGREEAGWAQLQQSERLLQAVPGKALRSYALALQADAHLRSQQVEAGLTAITEALALVEQTGERLWEAELFRIKGELLLTQERKEDSQKSKRKSQKSKIGSGNWELGFGSFSSQSSNPKAQSPEPVFAAEECFLKALAIARAQQAKSLELRAVMSLVRLRQSQASEHRAGSTKQRAKSKKVKVENESARKRESEETRKPELHPSLLASQPF